MEAFKPIALMVKRAVWHPVVWALPAVVAYSIVVPLQAEEAADNKALVLAVKEALAAEPPDQALRLLPSATSDSRLRFWRARVLAQVHGGERALIFLGLRQAVSGFAAAEVVLADWPQHLRSKLASDIGDWSKLAARHDRWALVKSRSRRLWQRRGPTEMRMRGGELLGLALLREDEKAAKLHFRAVAAQRTLEPVHRYQVVLTMAQQWWRDGPSLVL